MHTEDTGHTGRDQRALLIAPFAVWMVLMAFLPGTASGYAARSAIVAAIFLFLLHKNGYNARAKELFGRSTLIWGLTAGIATAIVWIAPEASEWYRTHLIIGYREIPGTVPESPYNPHVCGWALTLAKLAGSAFVIAPAEEFFYRKFLYNWAGADKKAFWITVALFALEHDRFLVGAIAGIIYGYVAIRKNLKSAIMAHVTTNFALGVYVITTGSWAFW